MTLRPLTESDLPLVLEWRNSPEIRSKMFATQRISLEEHEKWFERSRSNSENRHYIYVDESGEPSGFVTFSHCLPAAGSAFWGFYASPGSPPGTGSKLGLVALGLAFGDLGLHKINADVIANNLQSLRFHEKIGFQQEGLFRDYHFDGEDYIDVIRFGILAVEWPGARKKLQLAISSAG